MPESRRKIRILKDLSLSTALAVLTMMLMGLIDRLPFSVARDRVSDALRLPGVLVVGLVYPQGIHTGRGSPGAIYLGIAGLVGFYWLAWFLLIEVVGKMAHLLAAKK
jgi:hypothetical protein